MQGRIRWNHAVVAVQATSSFGESHKSKTSENQQIIRELRSEVAQMRASAVPPSLTRDLDAMIGSQKYEC